MKFGLVACDIGQAKKTVERAFSIVLEARDSSYRGGAYLRGSNNMFRELIVQTNWDDFDNEPIEDTLSSDDYIIYVTPNKDHQSLPIEQNDAIIML